jgi:hypothetical protein
MVDAQGLRRAGRAIARLALLAALLAALAGCVLVSGEETTIDLVEGGGNVLTTFVSAEGAEVRSLETGAPGAELQVIAVVEVETGDLQLELIQPDGAVAFVVSARPNTQITRSGGVRADDEGRVRYRVSATGARDGAFQIFVQQ